MCGDFYTWSIDEETNFRRLNLIIEKEFIKELDKFHKWRGETRECKLCEKTLPNNTYFFISHGDRDRSICKKCEKSVKYGWGRNKIIELNSNGEQYCKGCDRILPLNCIYFNKSHKSKTGYSGTCKECANNSNFGIRSLNDNILDIKDKYKVCQKCLLELPDSDVYYFKKQNKKNGSCICKKCKGFSYGEFRKNVLMKHLIKDNERFCASCDGVFKIEEMARCQSLCKECRKAYLKIFNQKPEQKERLRLARQKRRAEENKVYTGLSAEDIKRIFHYYDNSCAYCGLTQEDHYAIYNENLHCEHIEPLNNGGHFIKMNIVPACRSCNASKNTDDIFNFYDRKDSFTYERFEKIIKYINDSVNSNVPK